MAIKDAMRLRPDGVYELQVTINGKRKSFSSKDQDEVLRKMMAYKEEQGKPLIFKDIAEEWWTQKEPNLSKSTVAGYRVAQRRANEYFGDKALREITPSKIRSFLEHLGALGFARSTVKHHLVVLTEIFSWACMEHDYNENPAKLVSVPDGLKKSKRRMPTDQEIKKIQASAETEDGLFFYTLIYTGLRLGEALALQWQDVDKKESVIRVTKSLSWAGKNNGQIVPTKTENGNRGILYLDKLKKVLEPHRAASGTYVFGGEKPMTKQKYYCMLKRYRRETGLAVTPHQMRHAYATLCFEAGLDARTLQGLLGHAQLATSADIYAEIRAKQLTTNAKKLNEVDF